MTISIFLYIYLVLSALFFIYALFNLYHVFRFAHFDAASFFMTGLFIAGYILLLFISFTFIGDIDWSHQMQLFSTSASSSIPITNF